MLEKSVLTTTYKEWSEPDLAPLGGVTFIWQYHFLLCWSHNEN